MEEETEQKLVNPVLYWKMADKTGKESLLQNVGKIKPFAVNNQSWILAFLRDQIVFWLL